MKNYDLDNIISEDLNNIFNLTTSMWNEIKGKKLFFTGATGFFGTWILSSFIWANKKLNLNAKALVLSRNPAEFKKKFPDIFNDSSIDFHAGDIRNFEYPKGSFSHIIHGATTSATETFNNQDPLTKYEIITKGTRNVLEFAKKSNCEKFLYISSAAVYGKQPIELSNLSEEYRGAPYTTDDNFDHSVLGESKRISELLTTIYSKKYSFESKIARCFSFVGPYIPLNIHYAIGNFMRDALKGGPININSDGTSLRSYLYTSDLIVWLWTILFKGKNNEIYNVGSEEAISILKLAKMISNLSNNNIEININKGANKNSSNKYIPSIEKIKLDLGLKQNVNLKYSIQRTLSHIKNNKSLY